MRRSRKSRSGGQRAARVSTSPISTRINSCRLPNLPKRPSDWYENHTSWAPAMLPNRRPHLQTRKSEGDTVRCSTVILSVLMMALSACAAEQHSATGMVLKVDPARNSFTASCQEIPGYMAAMTMPFEVRQRKELDGLVPGAIVEFVLVVDGRTSYAEHV